MFVPRSRWIAQLAVMPALLFGFAQTPAGAANAVTLHISIKGNRFQPAELKVPANTPVILVVRNLDPTPEEFESNTLRVEKVVAGNSEITLYFRPLATGTVSFLRRLQRGDRPRRDYGGVEGPKRRLMGVRGPLFPRRPKSGMLAPCKTPQPATHRHSASANYPPP